MELRELRYFVAVAEDLHFGKAARRLHVSQPPLSQAIKRLEEELSATLLARTSRQVSLTPEGAFFLEEARCILERVDDAARTVCGMARGSRGRLNVGLVGPVLEGSLPCSIRKFRQKNPDVCVSLNQMYTDEQLNLLRSGGLDVGFVRIFGHDVQGVRSALYVREPYVMALPKGHRLAEGDVVDLSKLSGETMITFRRRANSELFDALLSAFRKAGSDVDFMQVSMVKHTASALVAAGMGLALMPRSMSVNVRPGVVHLPIQGTLPPVEFSLAWAKERETPLVRNFRDAILDCGSSNPTTLCES